MTLRERVDCASLFSLIPRVVYGDELEAGGMHILASDLVAESHLTEAGLARTQKGQDFPRYRDLMTSVSTLLEEAQVTMPLITLPHPARTGPARCPA